MPRLLTWNSIITQESEVFGGIFSELGDRRKAQRKRYELAPLLCAVVLATVRGASSLREIAAFIDERLEELNRLLGTNCRKAPSWMTIGRVLVGNRG
ncbi:hypothetical protein BN2476_140028 [Paraburkholderia piptadeniae]|uniref:H repeat-associated protein N-terminal domain-containing protein n=1 Tax=Paraburkholderia piptadeniae TaxID=1701573 RepID=A0A1N7RRS9_9BURK|nr:transposase family protein [Paraburkholderia piptadeniae]SIT37835.1 hypothetical protein BN2476_140028 [Paraburkholderia piptadeniae]